MHSMYFCSRYVQQGVYTSDPCKTHVVPWTHLKIVTIKITFLHFDRPNYSNHLFLLGTPSTSGSPTIFGSTSKIVLQTQILLVQIVINLINFGKKRYFYGIMTRIYYKICSTVYRCNNIRLNFYYSPNHK